MSNNSQQKTTFFLISDHRLRLQFKITWHYQSLRSLQAAATAPVEEAPGIPRGMDDMGAPSSAREEGSSDTAGVMSWKMCKPQNLQHKKGAQGKLPQALSFYLVNSLGPGRCINSLD